MQIAAVDDVIAGAVPAVEIDERQAVADFAGAPVAPGQADRLGGDGVQLVGKADRLEELDRVGADVDAGAELGELRRLLIDARLEALPAQRNGGREAAEAGSDNGNATRLGQFSFSAGATIAAQARRRYSARYGSSTDLSAGAAH
jgi:hypothetical protein